MQTKEGKLLSSLPAFAAIVILFTGLAFVTSPLQAQDNPENRSKPPKLFSVNDTLSVTMTGPWRDIERDKKNQAPYPAKLEFTDEFGQQVMLDITIERRGLTRQQVCKFPPIKLRFQKEAVKGTVFRGQKALKMVTHCEKRERLEQYYILEMLAYRMYNLITEYSFRVRPLNVTYVDSDKGKIIEDRFAFLIEDDGDVADRNDLKKLNLPKLNLSQLEPVTTSNFSLFQYLIANVDWAALAGPKENECCHNAKLIGPRPLSGKENVYPIPYDFDSSGLVNAHYAVPQQSLPIRSVTQRLFRGYCRHNDTLEAARNNFLLREAEIFALVDQEPRLNDSTRKKATKFIRKFYEIIKDSKDFEKKIIRKCRK
ncbi:MAG: hypothetical protein HKN57_14655 [Xanthomonadales bacterium]|nr:hypothetical protein [Gammaproteobacteria bacterium]MBT8053296.1 hypothetical protein [Gammaproteobacteria bacterium]NND58485.1 hypothetical protein [Xanthomonadales bacterium]NNK50094.1 hypothetical protein [Xanthomonadales bacterium]